MVETIKS